MRLAVALAFVVISACAKDTKPSSTIDAGMGSDTGALAEMGGSDASDDGGVEADAGPFHVAYEVVRLGDKQLRAWSRVGPNWFIAVDDGAVSEYLVYEPARAAVLRYPAWQASSYVLWEQEDGAFAAKIPTEGPGDDIVRWDPDSRQLRTMAAGVQSLPGAEEQGRSRNPGGFAYVQELATSDVLLLRFAENTTEVIAPAATDVRATWDRESGRGAVQRRVVSGSEVLAVDPAIRSVESLGVVTSGPGLLVDGGGELVFSRGSDLGQAVWDYDAGELRTLNDAPGWRVLPVPGTDRFSMHTDSALTDGGGLRLYDHRADQFVMTEPSVFFDSVRVFEAESIVTFVEWDEPLLAAWDWSSGQRTSVGEGYYPGYVWTSAAPGVAVPGAVGTARIWTPEFTGEIPFVFGMRSAVIPSADGSAWLSAAGDTTEILTTDGTLTSMPWQGAADMDGCWARVAPDGSRAVFEARDLPSSRQILVMWSAAGGAQEVTRTGDVARRTDGAAYGDAR